MRVDEAYAVAVASDNLRVQADCCGDVDCLIAVGWSPSRMGALLLRLHSEWDAMGRQVVVRGKRLGNAQSLLSRLRSFPQACEQVAMRLHSAGVDGAEAKARAVVVWWLCQVCPVCGGTKYEPMPGTGRLSARACRSCAGTGLARLPCGNDGRMAANWMDDCVNMARQSISKRLRGLQNRG